MISKFSYNTYNIIVRGDKMIFTLIFIRIFNLFLERSYKCKAFFMLCTILDIMLDMTLKK